MMIRRFFPDIKLLNFCFKHMQRKLAKILIYKDTYIFSLRKIELCRELSINMSQCVASIYFVYIYATIYRIINLTLL